MFRPLRATLFVEGSHIVKDACCFSRYLYEYWLKQGFWGALKANVVETVFAFLLFVASITFSMCFDWQLAISCVSTECNAHSLLVPVSFPYIIQKSPTGYFFGLALIFSSAASLLYELSTLIRSGSFHVDVAYLVKQAGVVDDSDLFGLGGAVPQEDTLLLSSMSWHEFTGTICSHLNRCESKTYNYCDDSWDVDRVTQSLLQLENFFVLFYDENLCEEGFLPYLHLSVLEWVIRLFLNGFNELDLSEDNFHRVQLLLLVFCSAYVLLYPCILAYYVFRTLARLTGTAKTETKSFLRREWSRRAKLKFRLYNEVSHLFEARVADGLDTANEMLRSLEGPRDVTKLVSRVCSTGIFLIVFITGLNYHLLSNTHTIWWLSLLLVLHPHVTAPDVRKREYNYLKDLEKLVGFLFFNHPKWNISSHSFVAHISRHYLFPRVVVVLRDLLEVTTLPVVLLSVLRDNSLRKLIVEMQKNSINVKGIGSICVRSSLDAKYWNHTSQYSKAHLSLVVYKDVLHCSNVGGSREVPLAEGDSAPAARENEANVGSLVASSSNFPFSEEYNPRYTSPHDCESAAARRYLRHENTTGESEYKPM